MVDVFFEEREPDTMSQKDRSTMAELINAYIPLQIRTDRVRFRTFMKDSRAYNRIVDLLIRAGYSHVGDWWIYRGDVENEQE